MCDPPESLVRPRAGFAQHRSRRSIRIVGRLFDPAYVSLCWLQNRKKKFAEAQTRLARVGLENVRVIWRVGFMRGIKRDWKSTPFADFRD